MAGERMHCDGVPTLACGPKAAASELIAAWPSSLPFEAQQILELHPELWADRSAVLDLAYEEFCRRTEAGEILSADVFARGFPGIQHSLLRQLHVHRFVEANIGAREMVPAAEWPSAGETFLGFSLCEQIGQGAFSRVFLASEECIGNRTVVVKISEFGGDEAAILGKLEHPGIVPIHSARRDEKTGLWAICMPFLGRATLLTVLDLLSELPKSSKSKSSRELFSVLGRTNRGTAADPTPMLPPLFRKGEYVEKVLTIGLRLAEALQFAHAAGICHGDLKPSNVLLTDAAEPKLLDFNLSFYRNATSLRRMGGTLPYMAPEQLSLLADGQAEVVREPDERADLFSLGAVLYELLAGALPFGPLRAELSRHELVCELKCEQQRGPRPLVHLGSPVDRHVSASILRCLALDPSARPASAAELASDFRELLSPRARVVRWARTHKAGSTAAALCALAPSAAIALAVSVPTSSSDAVSVPARASFGGRPWSAESDRSSAEVLAGGIRSLEAGEYAAAVTRFGEILEQQPNSPAARFWRGRALLLSGDYRRARIDLETVHTIEPSAAATACLAHACSLAKDHDQAIAYYREAIAQGLSTAGLWNNLAYSYWKSGRSTEAEECLNRAIYCDQGLAAAYHNRSQIEFRRGVRQGDPAAMEWLEKALVSIGRARELGDGSGELSRNRACIYARLAAETRGTDPSASMEFEDEAINSVRDAVSLGVGRQALWAVSLLLSDSQELRRLVESAPELDPRDLGSVPFSSLLVDPLSGVAFVAPD